MKSANLQILKVYIGLILTGLCFSFLRTEAQVITQPEDSINNSALPPPHTIFKPNATRAILYSAIVPGLGQIYNRKYWKLPLVYGSFIGCAYAINWNNSQYTDYKEAFTGFEDADETTDLWKSYVPRSYPKNPDEWTIEQRNRFSSALKSKKDYYRNYRDMSILITVAVYAVWIIDAYVDVQLFDFDVSPDLSMRVAPAVFEKTVATSRSMGVRLGFTF